MSDMKPEQPKLANLSTAREAAADAVRAKVARDVAEVLRLQAENRPMRLEVLAATAQECFDKFQALQKAGFTAPQALELCWRSL